MDIDQLAGDDEQLVREYDYEDGTVIAAELGRNATVDVVDGVDIVVFEDGEQVEIDLPSDEVGAFMRNGVLTIEVNFQ
jgi:hypothetical protein